MRISRLKDGSGGTIGIVLHFGQRAAPELPALAPEPRRTLWRVCNVCTDNDAVVYCRVHSVYLCVECLQAHEIMEGSKIVQQVDGYVVWASTWDVANRCEYLSRSTAQAMVD